MKPKDVTFSENVVKLIFSDDEDDETTLDDDHKRPFLRNGYASANDMGHVSSPPALGLPSIGRIKILNPKIRRARRPYRWLCCVAFLILIVGISYFLYSAKAFLVTELKELTSMYQGKSCSSLSSEIIWNSTLPLMGVKSSLELVDVNRDGELDIIALFTTGADRVADKFQSIVCAIYFNLTSSAAEQGCGSGLMALDGKKGSILWQKFVRHKLTSVNCLMDINADGVLDCIAAGVQGSLFAFDVYNGQVIWSSSEMDKDVVNFAADFYRPIYLSRDYDNDNIQDMILVHGGQVLSSTTSQDYPAIMNPAKMILASSKTGKILAWADISNNGGTHLNPQRLVQNDGSELILFSSSGPASSTSLFITTIDNLFHQRRLQLRPVLSVCCGETIFQPILVDLNQDSTLDIVASLSNGSVIAIDGNSFDVLWRKDFYDDRIGSEPGVAFFNEDQVPDIFVMYQSKNSTEVTVLDGNNGQPIVHPQTMLFGTKSHPLTVSVYGTGDVILFWLSTCGNTSDIDQSRASLRASKSSTRSGLSCETYTNRLNSSYIQLMSLARNNYSIIYDSRRHRSSQISKLKNFRDVRTKSLEEDNFLAENGQYTNDYTDQEKYQNHPDYESQSVFDYPYFNFVIRNRPIENENIARKRRETPGSAMTTYRMETQRITSTGTLTPSGVLGCVDVVFAVEWTSSTKEFDNNGKLDSKFNEIQNCIDAYINNLEQNDGNVQLVKENCAKYAGLDIPLMGSSVHRKRLKCANNPQLIRPYKEQIWPSFMGLYGDGISNVVKQL